MLALQERQRLPMLETAKDENSISPEVLFATMLKARETLLGNIREVRAGGQVFYRTIPSEGLYMHQWRWDADFVSMGLVHIKPRFAMNELLASKAGQWKNGFMPHVTYDPADATYYPQAELCGTEKIEKENNALMTSGITQPPTFAIAVEYVYNHSPKVEADKFLREIIDSVKRYHDYLQEFRDPENNGMLTIVHPWESGRDNSPEWRKALMRIKKEDIPKEIIDEVDIKRMDVAAAGTAAYRPTNEDYYRFRYLMWLYANEYKWDYKKIVAESPFAINDINSTCIWAKANESLANILDIAGRNDEAEHYRDLAKNTRKAIADNWSDEYQQNCSIDVSQGRHELIPEPTSAMFMPFLAGEGAIADENIPVLFARLTDPNQFGTVFPVPSMSKESESFNPLQYWKGCTWPPMNKLFIDGLVGHCVRKYGVREQIDKSDPAWQIARHISVQTITMIMRYGFNENFNPLSESDTSFIVPGVDNRYIGFKKFSWTAADFLQLLADYPEFLGDITPALKEIQQPGSLLSPVAVNV